MRFFTLILGLCLFKIAAFAQKSFTYITDRKFKDVSELLGYNFRPNQLESPETKYKKDLEPGSYAFGVTRNNLYVEGNGIAGVYNASNISGTEYGFKILLMDSKDPTSQGHLKIILNKQKQADAIIFLKSKKEKEMIFYMAEMPDKMFEEENVFFTDLQEMKIAHIDSLWKKEIYPFFRIHENGIQDRLSIADSTKIKFTEEITAIDKSKKKKTDKPGVEQQPSVITATDITPQQKEEVPSDKGNAAEGDKDSKKVKIIHKYFVELSGFLSFKDGTRENKKIRYEIKKMDEHSDTANKIGDNTPYKITLNSLNNETIIIALTSKKTISYIRIEDKTYLMRGF